MNFPTMLKILGGPIFSEEIPSFRNNLFAEDAFKELIWLPERSDYRLNLGLNLGEVLQGGKWPARRVRYCVGRTSMIRKICEL